MDLPPFVPLFFKRINKLVSASKQTTFQADLPSQFVYSRTLCSPSNVCSGCVRLASGGLPAYLQKLSSFSIEIEINSHVHRNVLVYVMDFSLGVLCWPSRLTFFSASVQHPRKSTDPCLAMHSSNNNNIRGKEKQNICTHTSRNTTH